MKQKIYVRDGRRFVEVVDPLLRVGCYVDNLGRFLDYRTVHSIGRCIGIKDGYYIVAWFDRGVMCTYSARLPALHYADWGVNTNSELYKNMYIPEIHELLWAVYEHPELFNANKNYLSNSSFHSQGSCYHYVRGLYFVSVNRIWDSGYGIPDFGKLIKVYGEED